MPNVKCGVFNVIFNYKHQTLAMTMPGRRPRLYIVDGKQAIGDASPLDVACCLHGRCAPMIYDIFHRNQEELHRLNHDVIA